MRNCLTPVAALAMTACLNPNVPPVKVSLMSETLRNEVRISFSGPQELPIGTVLRSSPKYHGPSNFFTVTLKNESSKPKKLPFPEIERNTITIYRNPATGAESIDNRTPPPEMDGAVAEFAPGESKSYQVVFEYPADIATRANRVALLHFCVKWDAGWLRGSAYAPGAFDWNESFELCRELRITGE